MENGGNLLDTAAMYADWLSEEKGVRVPSEEEISRNTRSRSAKLRVAAKI